MTSPPRCFPTPLAGQKSGFTLVELLVSMAVLVLMILAVIQLTDSATKSTGASERQSVADIDAQMTFSAMQRDFEAFPQRPDVDCFFWKNYSAAGSTVASGNDMFFFWCEAPSFFSGTTGTSGNISPYGLTGYRITNRTTDASWKGQNGNANYNSYNQPNFVLNRVSRGVAWDASMTGVLGDMVFMTTATNANEGSLAIPNQHTIFGGQYGIQGNQIGKQPPYDGSNAADNGNVNPGYTNVIADGVFRMEISYLLKDGTMSTKPVMFPSGAGVSHAPKSSSDPALTDDSSKQYVPGASRWWNDTRQKGYICTSASLGAARWTPAALRDVSAVIVTLAIMDKKTRVMVRQDATIGNQIDAAIMKKMVEAFPDANDTDLQAIPPKLPGKTWIDSLADANSNAFVSLTGAGVPKAAISQIRVYQRYFYIPH